MPKLTRTLKLTQPKSFLRFAKTMTVGELKNVSPQDINSYFLEWESTIIEDQKEDLRQMEKNQDVMIQECEELYGHQSKQMKYLLRNYNLGESIASKHYAQFPDPTTVKDWVENSQTGNYDDSCMPNYAYKAKENL